MGGRRGAQGRADVRRVSAFAQARAKRVSNARRQGRIPCSQGICREFLPFSAALRKISTKNALDSKSLRQNSLRRRAGNFFAPSREFAGNLFAEQGILCLAVREQGFRRGPTAGSVERHAALAAEAAKDDRCGAEAGE